MSKFKVGDRVRDIYHGLIANHGDVHRDMGAAELRAAARVFVSLAEALEQD